MSWIAVGVAAVGVVGGAISANKQAGAAEDAANAQTAASDASIAEQRRQYDQSRADYEPFRQAGIGALGRQEDVLGGDYSGFESSPDYLYARSQMQEGLDRSAASHGNLYSGGYGVDMATHLGGLASQNLDNYWAKLAGQANQGYNATSSLGGLGGAMAGNIGNSMMAAGDARASGYANKSNAWAGFGQQLQGFGGQLAGEFGGQPDYNPGSYGGGYGNYGGNLGSGWGSGYSGAGYADYGAFNPNQGLG